MTQQQDDRQKLREQRWWPQPGEEDRSFIGVAVAVAAVLGVLLLSFLLAAGTH